MIFVQPILDNFCDNFPLFLLDKNNRERERKSERINTQVSMRERVVPKVVKKWVYKYLFSIKK